MSISYAEIARSIRYQKCLRHPDQRLVVQVDRATGEYVPQCNDCVREGYSEPQLAPEDDQARRLGEMVNRELPAVREVVVTPVPLGQEQRPMTIAEFDDQLALIKHVVAQMQEDVHYGVIPGTRDRSLWEPGAEYLRAAFKISWSYELTEQTEDFETSDFRYEFRCFTVPPTQPAEWVSSAWSKERKFWCSRDCPKDCAQNHAPLGMERAMLPHNVKDRALKRGFVALMRNVTGTSGWFKQALDDETDGTGSKAADMMCPIHHKRWFKTDKMRDHAHPVDGATGPRGGKVWCNRAEVLQPSQNAQEGPQDDQQPLSEDGGLPQQVSVPQKASFQGKNLADLWNWGIKLGFKGGKSECLAVLQLKDDALIADLEGAAAELERIAHERTVNN